MKTRIAITIAVIATLIGCGTTSPGGKLRHVPASPAASTGTAPAPKARATGKPVSAEQLNAARTAQSYLDSESGFSRKGLIGQLKYEGYPAGPATAAVDSLGVDWNAQAALKARSYLEQQSFSRKGLIGQLKYEGFTTAQATYGVKQAGL